MPKYGLIGYPLSHSFSGSYFTEKFEKENLSGYYYDLYPLAEIKELLKLLASQNDLRGLNVTIPYKELVIPYLDGITKTAKEIGAVNTISIRNGKLYGDNTDVYGFENSLRSLLNGREPSGALVFGTGGAAKAVCYTLKKCNIPYKLVSRKTDKGDLTYNDISPSLLAAYPLLINTTPLGMHPNIETAPDLPYEHLTSDNILFDLVYNPEKTVFLKYGLERGCAVENGFNMLVLQAERSWEIWTKDLAKRKE